MPFFLGHVDEDINVPEPSATIRILSEYHRLLSEVIAYRSLWKMLYSKEKMPRSPDTIVQYLHFVKFLSSFIRITTSSRPDSSNKIFPTVLYVWDIDFLGRILP